MTLALAIEPFSSIAPELPPLFLRHWDEMAIDKDKTRLDINWQRYAQLESAGALLVATLREEGKLVGYSIMITMTGLHTQSCLETWSDMFWVAPEVRGRLGGLRLFRTQEKELQRLGVKRVHAGSHFLNDCSRLFVAMGYTPVERVFSKWIGDAS